MESETGWTRCRVESEVPEDFIDEGAQVETIYVNSRLGPIFLKIALKRHYYQTEVTRFRLLSYEECGPHLGDYLVIDQYGNYVSGM